MTAGAAFEERGVFAGVANELVLLREVVGKRQRQLLALELRDRLGEKLLCERTHGPVGVDAARKRCRGRLLEDAGGIARVQAHDAPHALLRLAATLGEQLLAQLIELGANLLGASEDLPRLPRGVEHALGVGEQHFAFARG